MSGDARFRLPAHSALDYATAVRRGAHDALGEAARAPVMAAPAFATVAVAVAATAAVILHRIDPESAAPVKALGGSRRARREARESESSGGDSDLAEVGKRHGSPPVV